MTLITASRTVLDCRPPGPFEAPLFAYCESETTRLLLPVEKWLAMGGPQHITATVEPGDLLNEDA